MSSLEYTTSSLKESGLNHLSKPYLGISPKFDIFSFAIEGGVGSKTLSITDDGKGLLRCITGGRATDTPAVHVAEAM